MVESTLNQCRPPLRDIPINWDDLPFTIAHNLVNEIPASGGLVLYGCWSAKGGENVVLPRNVANPDENEFLTELIARTEFKGASGCVEVDRYSRTVRQGVFGLGSASRFRRENIFYAGLRLGGKLKECGVETCTIILDNTFTAGDIQTLLWRLNCGLASTSAYKSKKPGSPVKLNRVNLQCNIHSDEFTSVKHRAIALTHGSILSMALCDAPPNYCNCISFSKAVEKSFANLPHVTVKILDEKACEEEKMGSFLGVAQGSYHGARLVHVTYKKGESKRKTAFVGKGITLDTGGLQIKPADGMLQMKCDKGGASAVMGAALTIAKMQPTDIEAHFIAMVCDNSVSDRAMYPRDILTASNGKTIEISHTDAEGRLALADGLVYAERQLGGPGQGSIVDIATLTGASLHGMGADIGCVYSNRDDVQARLINSARENGEPAWPLPIWPNYRKALNSEIADIKNSAPKPSYGGSIIAATFLEEFVDPETPWVHIDAAGPLWDFEKNQATGWGMGFLSDFALLPH